MRPIKPAKSVALVSFPAFEALGDKRSIAVARGKIADILQAQGDQDGALAMHLSRVETITELGDRDSLAHVNFSTAQIRLARGDHERGDLQLIHDELAEAFGHALAIGRPDFIGHIGLLLAQVLSMGGQRDQAMQVLDAADASFAKLGQDQMQAEVSALRDAISRMSPPPE